MLPSHNQGLGLLGGMGIWTWFRLSSKLTWLFTQQTGALRKVSLASGLPGFPHIRRLMPPQHCSGLLWYLLLRGRWQENVWGYCQERIFSDSFFQWVKADVSGTTGPFSLPQHCQGVTGREEKQVRRLLLSAGVFVCLKLSDLSSESTHLTLVSSTVCLIAERVQVTTNCISAEGSWNKNSRLFFSSGLVYSLWVWDSKPQNFMRLKITHSLAESECVRCEFEAHCCLPSIDTHGPHQVWTSKLQLHI